MKTFLFFAFHLITASCLTQATFELDWQYKYLGLASPFSIEADLLDRDYIYIASNEDGLVVLNTSGEFVSRISQADLGGQAKNLTQHGNLLFVAIGAHNLGNASGISVINISNPELPIVINQWFSESEEYNGSGVIHVENEIAYLGAMGKGLILLDISDIDNISFLSQIEFDINFPFPNPDNSGLYNARGMDVKQGIVYLCNDAGGIHIIDCTNPLSPQILGRFANPITLPSGGNRPRAYNNILVNDSLAYVAVDYCGFEILNISHPDNIVLMSHYNPHNCPNGLWWNAPIHANELVYDNNCELVFITTGKSEMIALDVSDPSNILEHGGYGSLTDTTATWGIAKRRDSIFLSYIIIPIYIPFIHPFDAKWAGIKMLNWTNACEIIDANTEMSNNLSIDLFPNPASEVINIILDVEPQTIRSISLYHTNGKQVYKETFSDLQERQLMINDLENYENGLYILRIELRSGTIARKILIQH